MADLVVTNGFETSLDEPTRRAIFDLRRQIAKLGSGGGTDSTGSTWDSAWGAVGYALITADQTISAAGDVAGLSITFTPVAGRRYKTTISMLIVSGNTAGIIVARILNGDGYVVQQRNYTVGINYYFDASCELVESDLPAVPTVRKANLDLATTTAQILASEFIPAFILVEDIGPVALSVPPPTQPDDTLNRTRWNTSWGIVATGTFAVAEGATFTTGMLLASPLWITLQVGRRYRFKCTVRAISATADSWIYVTLFRDDSIYIDDRHVQVKGAANFTNLAADWLVDGDGISHGFYTTTEGSLNGVIGYPAEWSIEDLGPVALTSPPPTPPGAPGLTGGGTTGQVLTKKSDVDYDAQWSTVSKLVQGSVTGGRLPVGGAITRMTSDLSLPGGAGFWLVTYNVFINSTEVMSVILRAYGTPDPGYFNHFAYGRVSGSSSFTFVAPAGATVAVYGINNGAGPVDFWADPSNHSLFAVSTIS